MLLNLRTAAATMVTLMLMSACTGDDGEAEESTETGESGETGDAASIFIPPGARLIEAGQVWRGCLEGDSECDSNENPGGMLEISAFFLDKYETTVDDYEACVDAEVCVEPADEPDCNFDISGRGSHPVNCISYDMATAYCGWKGMRLPTEAEWERAARADALTLYPWGDATPSCATGIIEGCEASTAEVGSAPAGDSSFGISDMSGNLSEWVSDYFDADYYAASAGEADPQGPESGSQHVLKGTSFTVPANFPAQRISKRNSDSPDSGLRIYGVRCARDR